MSTPDVPTPVTVAMTEAESVATININPPKGAHIRARYHRVDGLPVSDADRRAFDDAVMACAAGFSSAKTCVIRVPDGMALTELSIVEDVDGAA